MARLPADFSLSKLFAVKLLNNQHLGLSENRHESACGLAILIVMNYSQSLWNCADYDGVLKYINTRFDAALCW